MMKINWISEAQIMEKATRDARVPQSHFAPMAISLHTTQDYTLKKLIGW